MNTTLAGSNAERAVASLLEDRGFQVLELNWRTPFAEIDIVATKEKIMYFVEVKYRQTSQAGDGFDYITPQKLVHMQRAAEAWVTINNWQGAYELLAASVLGGGDNLKIDIREV